MKRKEVKIKEYICNEHTVTIDLRTKLIIIEWK